MKKLLLLIILGILLVGTISALIEITKDDFTEKVTLISREGICEKNTKIPLKICEENIIIPEGISITKNPETGVIRISAKDINPLK